MSEVDIDGDLALAIGEVEQELKYACIITFTTKNENNDCTVATQNKFNPRFLLGMSGCVRAALDSDEARLVMWLGVPIIAIILVQEMGWFSRDKSIGVRPTQQNKYWFKLYHCFADYVYINECIFIIKDTINANSSWKKEVV